jgi:hypothetical protein
MSIANITSPGLTDIEQNDLSMNTNLMLQQMDQNMTPEQKAILVAVGEQLDINLGKTTARSAFFSMTNPYGLSAVEGTKILDSKIKTEKTSSALKIGAAVIGGALLLKYLKGK